MAGVDCDKYAYNWGPGNGEHMDHSIMGVVSGDEERKERIIATFDSWFILQCKSLEYL